MCAQNFNLTELMTLKTWRGPTANAPSPSRHSNNNQPTNLLSARWDSGTLSGRSVHPNNGGSTLGQLPPLHTRGRVEAIGAGVGV